MNQLGKILNSFLIISMLVLAVPSAWASALRSVDADTINNSAHTVTQTLPTSTGTMLNTISTIAVSQLASGTAIPANTGGTGLTTCSTTGFALTWNGTGWSCTAVASSAITDELRLDSSNGYGSTNGLIRRYSAITVNTSSATYVDSASLGGNVTINMAGLYTIDVRDGQNGGVGTTVVCVTLNDPSVSASCYNQATNTTSTLVQAASPPDGGGFSGGLPANGSWTGRLAVNDVIRVKTQGAPASSPNIAMLKITRIGN